MRCWAALAIVGLSLFGFGSSAQAHERVWRERVYLLGYRDFVAVAHADYEAFILDRGAWRIATGHIVRQGSRRARVTHRRVRARR